MSRIAPECVAARRVLLDALTALHAHAENLILVGAQAVYQHTGDADLNVPIMTSDAYLAIDVTDLAEVPEIGDTLRRAGFAPGDNPGHWVALSQVAIDLMVVPHQSGGTRGSARAARLAPRDKHTARIARDWSLRSSTTHAPCSHRSTPPTLAWSRCASRDQLRYSPRRPSRSANDLDRPTGARTASSRRMHSMPSGCSWQSIPPCSWRVSAATAAKSTRLPQAMRPWTCTGSTPRARKAASQSSRPRPLKEIRPSRQRLRRWRRNYSLPCVEGRAMPRIGRQGQRAAKVCEGGAKVTVCEGKSQCTQPKNRSLALSPRYES